MGLRKTSALEPLREVVEREHPRDLPGLLAQLRSSDAEQRRWAARDLASHAEAMPSLGEALLSERDNSVRASLFTSLSTVANAASVSALLPLLRSEEAPLRNGAIEALAAMPHAVGPRIGQLLRDADPDVRIFTVNLLGDLRHPQVPQWLQQVLQHDGHVNVVASAVEVLAETGTPEDVPALRAAALRFAEDAFMGFAVAMVVERIETS